MKSLPLLAGLATLALGTLVHADAHSDLPPAVKARQAHMQLYAHNLGVLGGMAQEKIDYDAAAASAAAANLAALAQLDQSSYWPEGTDNASIEGTKALPAIWTDFDGVMTANEGLVEASAAMSDVAGDGLDALKGAMRPLGQACSACHQDYRQRDN
ncbi:c-type cytochrome [Thalassorhabdomicrobium marinisediminis]|uniref:c-type cytochrome n=1 Tax=Thalassorhabdomicrobium marinisediminis TaxID=2170577 RepID=UPI00248FBEF9|nr:cytochrome c [Thalassorhabdomicrobium marinisediminis]